MTRLVYNILSVQDTQGGDSYRVTLPDRVVFAPTGGGDRLANAVQRWVTDGGTVDPADPPPPPPTNAELVDMAGPVLVAFLKAYAAREGIGLAALKNAIVAEM